jgi:hypothetical protein
LNFTARVAHRIAGQGGGVLIDLARDESSLHRNVGLFVQELMK